MGELRTDLGKGSADFENLFQSLLRRFIHQWGVILQHLFEFMDGGAQRIRLCERYQQPAVGICQKTNCDFCGEL